MFRMPANHSQPAIPRSRELSTRPIITSTSTVPPDLLVNNNRVFIIELHFSGIDYTPTTILNNRGKAGSSHRWNLVIQPRAIPGARDKIAFRARCGFNPPQMNASPSPNLAGRLTEAFPTAGQIPAECRLDTRSYERLFLINGEIREWTGPLAEISSPICLRDRGALRRPVIGSVPAMDEAAALAALEAAARAWDDGRGHWPTLTVSARIEAVEAFVVRMLAVRDEVVKLLMWEIGKSLDDSRKEFDRTVDYIRKTIEALKDIDRSGSRFSLDGGVIAQVRRAPLGVCPFHGAVQLSAERDLHHAHPGADHGQHARGQDAQVRPAAAPAVAARVCRKLPAGGRQFPLGRGLGDHRPDHEERTHQRAGVHRFEPGGRHPQTPASAAAPDALHSGAGRQKPGVDPAGCRPGRGGEGMRDGQPQLQRPALHGVENPFRARIHRAGIPGEVLRRRQRAALRDALGQGRETHAASGV